MVFLQPSAASSRSSSTCTCGAQKDERLEIGARSARDRREIGERSVRDRRSMISAQIKHKAL